MLGLIEHVFPEQTVEQACHRDGAAMMETASAESLGQQQRLTGTLGIDLLLNARLGVEIIDSGEMEEVIDPADERFLLGDTHAELRMGHVPDDWNGALRIDAPVGQQCGYPLKMGCAHQEMHPAIWALQQFFNQPAADKTAAAPK
jgi:hypothetical protein